MAFSNTHPTKILVVEDDPYMQIILQEFLSANYDVEICENGMVALAFLQDGNIPDLILSDYNTPQLTGLELIDQVKSSDFFNTIPIMILSGEESSEKRIKCLDAGAEDFIVKPFNPTELASRIKVVLRRVQRTL
ncbi:MAG: response regulator [Sphingobacteriaceae bacterium]|nr:MAG: response regulator [Sphingobacteriaceae bacterium]